MTSGGVSSPSTSKCLKCPEKGKKKKQKQKIAVFVGSVHVMLTNVQSWGMRYFCPNKYDKKEYCNNPDGM